MAFLAIAKQTRFHFTLNKMSIVKDVEAYVKLELKNNDGSHDWFHIDRVRKLALKIASDEHFKSQSIDVELVEIGALLHDIGDWKYSRKDVKTRDLVDHFLTQQNYDANKKSEILDLINSVSFKNELANKNKPLRTEFAIVQDADRLDAMGAIGVARAFAFSGAKKAPLYDPEADKNKVAKLPTKEEYEAKKHGLESTYSHFLEKLIHLKDMIKTVPGRKLAEERQDIMSTFFTRFVQECEGKC